MTERERFERWWRDKKQTKVSPVTLDSTYAHAWEAWRAAKEESEYEIERKDKAIDSAIGLLHGRAYNYAIEELKAALSGSGEYE